MKFKLLRLFTFLFLSLAFHSTNGQPNWIWAASAGGADYSYARDIAVDHNGHAFVAGTYTDSMLVLGNDTLINVAPQIEDIVVIKYNNFGNVVWAKKIGGDSGDNLARIVSDANENIIVGGSYSSSNLSIGSLAVYNSVPGSSDIFVCKYDNNGNALWAKNFAGSGTEILNGLCVDADGNIYLNGWFESSIDFGLFHLSEPNYGNLFLTKLDSNGNALWARVIATNAMDAHAASIQLGMNNNLYLTGHFDNNMSFDTTTLTISNTGYSDIFYVKFDSTGAMQWAKSAGNNFFDIGSMILPDQYGNFYLTGYYSDSLHLGSISLPSSGSADLYLAKFDGNGNAIWAQKAGGTGWDEGLTMVTDVYGGIILMGDYSSNTLSFGNTNISNSNPNLFNLFMTKYDTSGTLMWVSNIDSTGDDVCYSSTIDVDGNVYMTGGFNSQTLSFGSNTIMHSGTGINYNMFVAKSDALLNGVKPNIHSNNLSVYPNPFNNNIRIENKNPGTLNVQLFDVSGKLILNCKLNSTINFLDTEKLPGGFYLLKISDGINSDSYKVVKD